MNKTLKNYKIQNISKFFILFEILKKNLKMLLKKLIRILQNLKNKKILLTFSNKIFKNFQIQVILQKNNFKESLQILRRSAEFKKNLFIKI